MSEEPQEPDGGEQPAAPGVWQRLRQRLPGAGAGAPRPARCVIIGPVSSGKSALLYSLARCVEADSHSYQGRLEVNLTAGNRDFDKYRGEGLNRHFQTGLVVDATGIDSVSLPEFTLEVHRLGGQRSGLVGRGAGRAPGVTLGFDREFTFTAFDGSGGLLLGRMDEPAANRSAAAFPGAPDQDQKQRLQAGALAALNAALTASESVILCIPLAQAINQEQTQALAARIFELRKRPALRRLVVCFTMYEKLGAGCGRAAYRLLANRTAARRAMAAALGGSRNGILKALKSFRRRGKGLWCVPVSTYGFIPGNGGINFDPQARTLLTRTPRSDREAPTLEAPYDLTDAWAHWQPFCTIDPFVFIATGETNGTLIHTLDELGF